MTTTATKPTQAGVPINGATPPCIRCHDPGGYTPPRSTTPKRLDAARYGLQDKVCAACETTLRRQAARKGRPRAAIKPCAHCGDPGGYVNRGAGDASPSRFNGAVYGVPGRICLKCQRSLSRANPDAVRAAREKRDREQRQRAADSYADRANRNRATLPFHPLVPCCDLCGTSGGACFPGTDTPARYEATEFDLEGRVCAECRDELTEERARLRAAHLRNGPGPHYRQHCTTPRWEATFPLIDAGPYSLDDLRGPMFTRVFCATFGPIVRRATRPVVLPEGGVA